MRSAGRVRHVLSLPELRIPYHPTTRRGSVPLSRSSRLRRLTGARLCAGARSLAQLEVTSERRNADGN